jgi:hypothetical protein
MNIKVILSVTLVVLLIGQSVAQRQNRRRNRGRKRDQCHLREMEACINKMQDLGKGPNPSVIITTNAGINKICNTIRDDMTKCIKGFFKKCGSPLHREVLDLMIDQMTNRVTKFCRDDNPAKIKFLEHSPCMHEKVFSTSEYKSGCNNNFLAVVDKIDDHIGDQADSTHETLCCGYGTWYQCTSNLIQTSCGSEAVAAYKGFLGNSFGTLTNMACPADLFAPESEQCQKVKPKAGTKAKGKVGDNALTKYVTSMFSFLFVTNE